MLARRVHARHANDPCVASRSAGRLRAAINLGNPRSTRPVRSPAPRARVRGAAGRGGSPLRDNAEVDRAGTRVVVGQGSAYDLFLTRELKAAEIVRAPSSQAVLETYVAGGHEVAAGVRQQLEADMARFPGQRLLPGRFMVIQQAMGCAKDRGADAAAALAAFVEDVKASGFVADALERHRQHGASVAPPAA
jgi:polar amino acid transport system substrate-binding protein